MSRRKTIGVGLKRYQERFKTSHQVCRGTQGRTGGVNGPVGSLNRFRGSPNRGVGIFGPESLD